MNLADLFFDDDARRAARQTRTVVVPTDSDVGDDFRRVATQLARRHDWQLVIYDRSNETWMDTPHATGPHFADDLDVDEHPHLIRAMRDVEAAGVDVRAWISTVPSISAIVDAIREIGADALLIPAEFDEASIADAIQIGERPDRSLLELADRQLDDPPTIFAVHDDGRITVTSLIKETA